MNKRCEWRSNSDPQYRCPEPPCYRTSNSGPLCILHTPDPKKDRNRLQETIERKKKSGDMDFRGTIFVEELVLEGKLKAANFSRAAFYGPARFEGVEFENNTTFARCTFHALADFTKTTFVGDVGFAHAIFGGPSGFVKSRFAKSVSFEQAQFHKQASFERALFGGKANFRIVSFASLATFLLAGFCSDVSFEHANFLELVSFEEARFHSYSDFSRAEFHGEALFGYSKFGVELEDTGALASFREVIFHGAADFSLVRFAGGAIFRRVSFKGNCSFRHTLFAGTTALIADGGSFIGGSADFRHARFGGQTYFEKNQLQAFVDLNSAEFATGLFFRGPSYSVPKLAPIGHLALVYPQDASPPEILIEDVLLEQPEKVRFEEFDLRRVKLAGTNIRKVEFRNVVWPKSVWFARDVSHPQNLQVLVSLPQRYGLGNSLIRRTKIRVLSLWTNLLRKAAEFLSHNTTADERALTRQASWEDFERVRRLFRDLKASLDDQKDYADAGDFYYAEMEIRRHQSGWFRGFLFWLYWLVCGYGEKPLRAFVAFLCMWVILAASLIPTSFKANQSVKWRDSEYKQELAFHPYIKESVGHALRSLTLQQRGGYLDPYTPNATQLTLLANIFGPIQLGLLALSLRRRFRR